jgi:hypothetical protein
MLEYLLPNLKVGFQGETTALPCLPEHWCDLWRHWYQVCLELPQDFDFAWELCQVGRYVKLLHWSGLFS